MTEYEHDTIVLSENLIQALDTLMESQPEEDRAAHRLTFYSRLVAMEIARNTTPAHYQKLIDSMAVAVQMFLSHRGGMH